MVYEADALGVLDKGLKAQVFAAESLAEDLEPIPEFMPGLMKRDLAIMDGSGGRAALLLDRGIPLGDAGGDQGLDPRLGGSLGFKRPGKLALGKDDVARDAKEIGWFDVFGVCLHVCDQKGAPGGLVVHRTEFRLMIPGPCTFKGRRDLF